jgi:hypothetical protein
MEALSIACSRSALSDLISPLQFKLHATAFLNLAAPGDDDVLASRREVGVRRSGSVGDRGR